MKKVNFKNSDFNIAALSNMHHQEGGHYTRNSFKANMSSVWLMWLQLRLLPK